MKATELPADAEPFTPDSLKPGKNGALDLNGSGAVIMILVAGPSGPSGRMTVKGSPFQILRPSWVSSFGVR